MTFTVTVKMPPVEVTFEAGSIGEAAAILSDNQTALASMFAVDIVTGHGAAPAAETPEKRKGRGPNKPKPDLATAQAPPPAPVPDAYTAGINAKVGAGTPPAPATDGLAIPGFLQRPAPAAPPAPAPAAPPAPPPAPPMQSALGAAVVAEVKKRTAGAPDGGKAMVDWLVGTGAVISGATLDEALACLPLIPADKLAPIAGALGVAG